MKSYFWFFIYACILFLCGIASSARAEAVHEGMSIADELSQRRSELTEKDFLAVPFDPVNDEMDRKMLEEVLQDPRFVQFRTSRALLHSNLDLVTYDRLHRQYLEQVATIARNFGITFNKYENNFSHVLSLIDAASSSQSEKGPGFLDMSLEIEQIRQATYLFEARSTLMEAVHEDAVLYLISGKVNQAIDWLIGQFNSKKCQWCKQLVSYIKKKACQAAGSVICNGLTKLAPFGLGFIAGKFVCNAPIHLATTIANWCNIGLAKLQDATGISDDCICSFKIPTFSIPSCNILGVKINGKSVGGGPICSTNAACEKGSQSANNDPPDEIMPKGKIGKKTPGGFGKGGKGGKMPGGKPPGGKSPGKGGKAAGGGAGGSSGGKGGKAPGKGGKGGKGGKAPGRGGKAAGKGTRGKLGGGAVGRGGRGKAAGRGARGGARGKPSRGKPLRRGVASTRVGRGARAPTRRRKPAAPRGLPRRAGPVRAKAKGRIGALARRAASRAVKKVKKTVKKTAKKAVKVARGKKAVKAKPKAKGKARKAVRKAAKKVVKKRVAKRKPAKKAVKKRAPKKKVVKRKPAKKKVVKRKPAKRKPVKRKPVRRKPVRRKPIRRKPVRRRAPARRKPVRKPAKKKKFYL